MLKSVAFANAATVVTVIFYVICWALAYIVPNFLFGIAVSWFHILNLDALRAVSPVPVGTGILGLISIAIVTWVTTYALIELYNRWAKK